MLDEFCQRIGGGEGHFPVGFWRVNQLIGNGDFQLFGFFSYQFYLLLPALGIHRPQPPRSRQVT
ncbi:Uncharacterised protein [Yokenella regensburgei]|nr:Uncharacterised protein [Yokenella regensburgei]